MANDLTITEQADDGWADAAADNANRVLKGRLLRFADWQWTAGKNTRIEKGTQLIVTGTAAAWVKWNDGKPVEYKMRETGKRMPDRDELGDTDETTWERGLDKEPIDPWQNTRFVYLLNPTTLEAYTFSTHSWGGRNAVGDLADQIARARNVRPGAVPLVELQAAEMPTKFGRKSKPLFRVAEWRGGHAERPKELEHATPAEAAMSHEIPF